MRVTRAMIDAGLKADTEHWHSMGRDRIEAILKAALETENKPDKSDPLTQEFEAWWLWVPRKDAKKDALKAYRAARKTRSMEQLLADMKSYRSKVQDRAKEHILLPASWLRGERWNDDATGGMEASVSVSIPTCWLPYVDALKASCGAHNVEKWVYQCRLHVNGSTTVYAPGNFVADQIRTYAERGLRKVLGDFRLEVGTGPG